MVESLNSYFITTVDNLDIEPFTVSNTGESHEKSVKEIIQDYDSHPSIQKIKEHFGVNETFSFQSISPDNFEFRIANIDA